MRVLYIKTYKTGSSTLAGILRTVAAARGMHVIDPGGDSQVNRADWQADLAAEPAGRCFDMVASHTQRAGWQDEALPGATRITIVRDPVQRALSGFYHSRRTPFCRVLCCSLRSTRCKGSLGDAACTAAGDALKLRWARECTSMHDAQLAFMVLSADEGGGTSPVQAVSHYDLVAVMERFDESLVVLRHVLGLELGELLYVKAKSLPHNYTYNLPGGEGSTSLPPVTRLLEAEELPAFKAALAERNRLDTEMVAEANRRLDEHVAAIGKHVVMQELAQLQELQQQVLIACADAAAAARTLGRPGYDPWNDCHWRDNGCARDCIANVRQLNGV
ncbi:hypothetical protein FOA52_015624 [Chlamydomonas sp. UWO 241]|nr:hypothetical protein FOA52_015624 [Chlamydomonas sp. UWO 241]